jgi:hypothetical protein
MKYSILFIILFSWSCAHKPISKEIKREFTNRFEGKNTGIREKLNMDGYYQYWRQEDIEFNPQTKQRDTFFYNLIFYEDGTYLYNFSSFHDYPQNPDEYLKQVAKNGKTDRFYVSFYWGIYKIAHDTIVAQFIDNVSGAYLAPWSGGEAWFKIIDRNTLQYLYYRNFKKRNHDEIIAAEKSVANSSLAIYHSSEILPPPYAWLKKEKWLWANEEDWKRYMELIKQ